MKRDLHDRQQKAGNWLIALACLISTICPLPQIAPAAAPTGVESRPLDLPGVDPAVGPAPGASKTRFETLSPERTGIDFVQPVNTRHRFKFLFIGGYASAGVAIGDLNGDGLQDVFFTGGPVRNRLYLQTAGNDGKAAFRFRDATTAAGIGAAEAWGAGVAMVDIDNDGDLDIYICNYDSPNELYVNETTSPDSPRFVESAKAYGLDLVDASFMPAFCDYDLDGDLDLFIATYQYVDPEGRPAKPPVIEKDGRYFVKPGYRKYYAIMRGAAGRPLFTNAGRQDYLYQSNASEARRGQITFRDVTRQAGIQGLGNGNSVVWWDYNDDGLMDIYIGNDFKVPDQLYRNNGNGTFTDVIRSAVSHTTWFSMGSDAGDVNNDGRIDLFVTDMAGTTHYRSKVSMGEMHLNKWFLETAEPRQFMRNALLINTGTPRFLEAAYMAGIAKTDWTWAAKLADLDNDGWLDVFVTNGAARMFNHSDHNLSDKEKIGKTEWDVWEGMPRRLEENLAFRNLGDLRFENVSAAWGLQKQGMSYSTAYGDLDNDGDLDLIVTNLDEPVTVYRNQSAGGHRLRIRLAGTRSNRFGLGAVVRIETNQGIQMRQMMPMTGFLSCNEPVLHFGLGTSDRVEKLTVQWPSGIEQVLDDLQADHLHTVTEPQGAATRRKRPALTNTAFVPSKTFPALRHIEKPYDDFARQPLLPYKHSQLGPGLAVGDIDGDGDADFYLGRAKGAKRAVYQNRGKGRLGVTSVPQFRSETDFEDAGALFFDADKDGDRDLYVVSGSVECNADDKTLRDRLYLNDGQGSFTVAAGALPEARVSGSVVCAADFDRDGDLDLFVGGRVVPGQYPVTPRSQLLENQSEPGKPAFDDIADRVAPGLSSTGLVTSAVWSDADDDGWIDLLVTHEWGPVKYYRNEADPEAAQSATGAFRMLVDRTAEVGLADHVGWFNGIAARDLDNDGDIDYVVTNFGLNTQYHASADKPELLYYGDFDGSGRPHLLEAKFESDKCFPRRGLSCSSHAMPFVRDKVKTFHNFGLVTLEEIYTEQRLDESLRLEANTLESGLLINLGNKADGRMPRFRFQPLPRLAQISPSFGVVVEDFDADGWADCFLAQNFFSPQMETGRMDSGLSVLLRGRGSDADNGIRFEPVWPEHSGIVIPADAKAVSVVDFNEDGWNDLLVTVNNGVVEAFEAQPHPTNRPFRLKLVGPPGNLDCVGARGTVRFEESSAAPRTAEVFAGGGYLSQSSTELVFGCGMDQPRSVHIRWPNGVSTDHALEGRLYEITIRQP